MTASVDVNRRKRKLKKIREKLMNCRKEGLEGERKHYKTRFQQRVNELVRQYETLVNGVFKACDEVCGKKKDRRNYGNT